MKKILITFIVCIVSLQASHQSLQTQKKNQFKDDRLCKIFQQKVVNYQKHMRSDEYAKATLASYKKRAAMFCGK